MHASHRLLNPYPWLNTLKASQLQRIAQATGIQSSGPKAALLTRLQTELPPALPSPNPSSKQDLSILSIDMGIRNLAYAHLVNRTSMELDMELTAWRRLSITPTPTPTPTPAESFSYSPQTYARAAYELLTTLLRYHPTHILIERQRFRSGGAAAVQEWTLRVGVFEGMLYAVLYTLRRMGGEAPVVVGVEPRRVGRYWEMSLEEEGQGRKRKGREGKKAKIDLVGGWLDGSRTGLGSGSVGVGSDPEVRDLVEAYLARWKGKKKGKGEEGPDVSKMDDLADCLVQGVTWLEWQAMRRRISEMGIEAMQL